MTLDRIDWSKLGTLTQMTLTHELRVKKEFLAGTDNMRAHKTFWQDIYGRRKKVAGGTHLKLGVVYAKGAQLRPYIDWEEMDTKTQRFSQMAQYDWRSYAIPLTMSGTELRKNNSVEQFIPMLKSKVENTRASMIEGLAEDVWGLGADGRRIAGLKHIVSDTGGGTVGGLASTQWPFWKNKRISLADRNQTLDPTSISDVLTDMHVSQTRNQDMPDAVYCSQRIWIQYNKSFQAAQPQARDPQRARQGYANIGLMDIEFKWDAYCEPDTTQNGNLYMLNRDYLGMFVHTNMDMDVIGPKRRFPVNQDGFVTFAGFMGNMWCSNRGLQGVLITG